MKKDSKIFVTGHRGLAGSAMMRLLEKEGYTTILTRTRAELDLLDQKAVEAFFIKEKPEYVFHFAAKVGGIKAAYDFAADFMYENLTIQNNVIHAAYLSKVKKLIFVGSACIYPKLVAQPIKEEYFMTNKLEPSNEAYSSAKIAGIMLCQSYNRQYGTNFISAMPTNLYGQGDNFDPEHSHVLPALMRKFHEAKKAGKSEVVLWGDGAPRREFLHSDDLASACLFIMNNYDSSEIVNVGLGEDISIKEIAGVIKKIVGFDGAIQWDTTKPNGVPRRLLDMTKLHTLGWHHEKDLTKGLAETYEWFKKNYE